MSWANDLGKEISGRVLTDDAACQAVATDFGRIVSRRPQVWCARRRRKTWREW